MGRGLALNHYRSQRPPRVSAPEAVSLVEQGAVPLALRWVVFAVVDTPHLSDPSDPTVLPPFFSDSAGSCTAQPCPFLHPSTGDVHGDAGFSPVVNDWVVCPGNPRCCLSANLSCREASVLDPVNEGGSFIVTRFPHRQDWIYPWCDEVLVCFFFFPSSSVINCFFFHTAIRLDSR